MKLAKPDLLKRQFVLIEMLCLCLDSLLDANPYYQFTTTGFTSKLISAL